MIVFAHGGPTGMCSCVYVYVCGVCSVCGVCVCVCMHACVQRVYVCFLRVRANFCSFTIGRVKCDVFCVTAPWMWGQCKLT